MKTIQNKLEKIYQKYSQKILKSILLEIKPHIIDYILFIDNKDGAVSKIHNIFKSGQFYYMKVKDELYNVFWTGSASTFPLIEDGNNFIPIQETHPFETKRYYGIIWFNKQQFQIDLDEYNKYLTWKKNRNPIRHELEKNYGFDLKHAAHTFRLLLTGIEILQGKGVLVKRPDAQFLLDIRQGKYTYEWVLAEAERLNKELEELYKTSTLRNSVDPKLYIDLIKQIIRN